MMFSQLNAFKTLQELSKKPVDLTTLLTPERVEKMVLKAVGFTLDRKSVV